MLHKLKLNENFVQAVFDGCKNFEIRKNDRGFQTGDLIQFIPVRTVTNNTTEYLSQYNHPITHYTFEITYILNGYGLKNGYVVLALLRVD